MKARTIKGNSPIEIIYVLLHSIVEKKRKAYFNAISQKVLDKIFQPPSDRVIRAGFFTTKPTGHGTGLGLSLSYDIAKAHGGEIKVGSREGEGSEFIIQIPLKKS